jgi:hypothetical protein
VTPESAGPSPERGKRLSKAFSITGISIEGKSASSRFRSAHSKKSPPDLVSHVWCREEHPPPLFPTKFLEHFSERLSFTDANNTSGRSHRSRRPPNLPGNLLDPGEIDVEGGGDFLGREDSLGEDLFNVFLTTLLTTLLKTLLKSLLKTLLKSLVPQ